MKIYLQHLNYTVHVHTIKTAPKDIPRAKAYVEKGADGKSCCMYLPKKRSAPTVAHELVHVLQFIAEARGIDMVREWEHMGYLMQFLMCKILGYSYV